MKSPALHIQDKTRNVRGDLYPTLCGVYVTRNRLTRSVVDDTCADCHAASNTTVIGMELTPDMIRKVYGRMPGDPRP